jgi:hypothetical protein
MRCRPAIPIAAENGTELLRDFVFADRGEHLHEAVAEVTCVAFELVEIHA